MVKDTLVIYKGGGYDGCFWEWNAFLFDANGDFHAIYYSGRNGITDQAQAEAMLKAEEYMDLIDLNNPERINFFDKEYNAGLVIQFVKAVNEVYGSDKMHLTCDMCEAEITEGIAINPGKYQYNGKVCEDCLCSHTCAYCGEWHDDEEECNQGEDGCHCTYCLPEKVSE